MTGVTLQTIVRESIADIGVDPGKARRRERHRTTEWVANLPGFGIRTYMSGRQVYIVQTRMAGRLRTVTLCNVRLLSRTRAREVARGILLRAYSGENPADERQQARKAPKFDAFLQRYWERMAPTWKASTVQTHDTYRRLYIDGAFGARPVDRVTHAEVAEWFARVAEKAGGGGANRALEILKTVFAKAEE